MRTVFEQVIPPKRGLALTVKKGQHLRVTDLEGQQVVDMSVSPSVSVSRGTYSAPGLGT